MSEGNEGNEGNEAAARRLAVYGSLRPGGPNHHVVRGLDGDWHPGTVRGHLHDHGWGAGLGYPGVIIDPEGPAVPVMVLSSPALPEAWARIDEFEGPEYRRRVVTVDLDGGGRVRANIYEARLD